MDSERDDAAAILNGDGMPIGNEMTPLIQRNQVELPEEGKKELRFDDDAAGTIAWENFQLAQQWLDNNSWLAEWQYVDYLYQSPNYDRDWRNSNNNQAARISRFNILRNTNTMTTQVRRGIFGDDNFFLLEPRGKLAGEKNAQDYIDAITELLMILCDRADFQYNMELMIDCAGLQGTGIAVPGWEERTVIRETRKRKAQPVKVEMPVGGESTVNTWESDQFEITKEEVTESWPFFEYRRLGTTLFDEKWRTPNRPEKSAAYRIDINYVTLEDLRQMREEVDCYKDIPNDEDLIRYFLQNPYGDASTPSQTAQAMNANTSTVLHAEGEERNTSENPFQKPMMLISQWTAENVIEMLVYEGRHKVIRNDNHDLDDYALGFAANWINIDNCGYGIGIGRINAGDQRMAQGILNEVLKMIAYPFNAPLLYNTAYGNEPTQNNIQGLGSYWGLNAPPGEDMRKVMTFLQRPEIPGEAFTIYQKIALEGGESVVGANATTMQGQLQGPGSSAMRTAAGVNRVGSKADENVSTPIQHFEYVIERWLQFLWRMVVLYMPLKEIREILSDKFSADILDKIDTEILTNAKFSIKILAGQKLAAKAAIGQLIPFLLQIIQQPALSDAIHQIGKTIDYSVIEKLFIQASELNGRQDIFVDMTPQQKAAYQQNNPAVIKMKTELAKEQQRGQNEVATERERGQQDQQTAIVGAAAKAVADKTAGATQLDNAEARLERNQDMSELEQGAIPQE